MKARHVTIALVWAASLVGVGVWAQAPGTYHGGTWNVDASSVRRVLPAEGAGAVAGAVSDTQGGAIPGATVVLIDEAQGSRSTPVITDASGNFVFPSVAPGAYTIDVTMPGFRELRRPHVRVDADGRAVVQALVMEVAGQFDAGPPRPQPRSHGDGVIDGVIGRLVMGNDIAFQPMRNPHAPAGTVAGRWMVRIDGRWYEASGVPQAMPTR